MPFAVDDFQDLLRLLDQHPEWQAELRRRVLTDELLELPALVRRIVEGQMRTDEQLTKLTSRVDTMAKAMETLTARVDTMAKALEALTVRVDTIATALEALTARVDTIATALETLTAGVDTITIRLETLIGRVDALAVQIQVLAAAHVDHEATVKAQGARLDAALGDLAEARYERRAGAYFSHLARRIRVINHSILADLLEDAVDEGRIARGDRQDMLQSDLVLTGRRREDGAECISRWRFRSALASTPCGAPPIGPPSWLVWGVQPFLSSPVSASTRNQPSWRKHRAWSTC